MIKHNFPIAQRVAVSFLAAAALFVSVGSAFTTQQASAGLPGYAWCVKDQIQKWTHPLSSQIPSEIAKKISRECGKYW